jgi:hypothetical protein
MKRVDIQELREHALRYLTGDEALTIELDGQPLGYYIPSKAGRRRGSMESIRRLEQTVQRVMAETGLTEEELSRLFDLNQPLPEWPEPRPEVASETGASGS